MRKLLIINNNAFFNKGEKMLVYKETGRLFQRLTERFDVSAFHFKIPLEEQDSLADYDLNIINIGLNTIERNGGKLVNYIKSFGMLWKLINRVDMLYLFYPNSFYFAGFLAVLFRKPFGLYVRGEKGLDSWSSKYLFRKASFILTVSPKFTKLVGRYNSNNFTIKPMISYSINEMVDRDCKRELGNNILFVGRIEKEKGIFELIEAIRSLVKDDDIVIRAQVIGDGEAYNEVKELIEKLELNNNIELIGPVYDPKVLKHYYLSNDIFLLPTHHEGFPRVLYEAMIFQLACVTTFVGAIPSIMIDDYNCLEIKVNSPEDIKKKLVKLIENEALKKTLIDNGRITIKKYFEVNKFTHDELIVNNFLK